MSAPRAAHPLLLRLGSPWIRAGLPLAVVLALGAIFNQHGAFFDWETHRALLREVSVLGILACGMTVVIVTAGIDLSVGSVLALSAVSFALLTMHGGWSGAFAIPLVLAVGTLLGLVSGALVARARIQAFIVTLAMMVFARGLAKELSGGQKVSSYFQTPDGRFVTVPQPAVFEAIDSRVLGDSLSIVTLVFVAAALVTWLVLERLRIGRYLFAVGGNLEAARLAGVPVQTTLLFAYALAGFFSALAGICQAAQETQGDPETGTGYELDAIAMVVLGGTSLAGGRGGVGRTLVGCLTLGYLQKVLSLNAYSTPVRMMLTGAILVFAVLLQRRTQRS
ncbi:MAG TPA: ABC transporter permease [Polyangiaceae bacterium]|nr:ABC transporter permease [Polyangiaceae bacterium]